MSLVPPTSSLAITAGEFQPLASPVCVVLIQKLSVEVPISGWLADASMATRLPLPSNCSADPDVALCPATHTGAGAAPAVGKVSSSVPAWCS